ncbi:ExeA family protein, partial [Paracidovorax anthurii]|uniref:ExeA family protein n=1 Tax=Paracidovorax anthurii TaxID=78229 RepID=UPI0039F119CC
MYAPFFGLEHAPFSIAPDPRYLFMSDRHREALAHLLYGLEAGGGFVLLTGEIGAGKTTVCRCFLEQIPAHCNVAYVFNPKLTVGELLRSICDEFGVAHAPAAPGAETVKDCLDPLNAFLLREHAAGRNNVLIIDEAQSLAPEVLEQLRLLTNLETSERKLLQIVLIGQPELRAMVASPELEQLAQRVIARFHLGPLTAGETRQYVAHRLAVAGLQGPLPFNARALERIHQRTRGVPRRINLLCDRALLGAYAGGVREVDEAIVERAAREVFDAEAPRAPAAGRAPRWPRWAVAD